ncbi:MAG TPA: hypothetical protein PLW39_13045 [Thermoflexales bacterium]|nr:hypothetical protein [Thermoflexales bacterium]HQW34863.1 hypothetical protein [Thermoflexales bacterium]HQZ23187.1 hypothetical protein [Thermoflexales bacterium]
MAELPIADRAFVRDFLSKRFSLAELKDLAFDIGIDPDEIPSDTDATFSRELIAYCERRATPNVGCLLSEIAKRRPDDMITRLANAQNGACQRLLQFVLPGNDASLSDELMAALRAVLQKHPDANVQVLGVLPGSVRVLVSLPDGLAAEFLDELSKTRKDLASRVAITEVKPLEALPQPIQNGWRDEVYRRALVAAPKPKPAAPPATLLVVGFAGLAILAGAFAISLPSVSVKNNCATRIPPSGDAPLIGALQPGASLSLKLLPGSATLAAKDGAVSISLPGVGALPVAVSEDNLGNVTIDGQRPKAGDSFALNLGSSHTVVLCAGGR